MNIECFMCTVYEALRSDFNKAVYTVYETAYTFRHCMKEARLNLSVRYYLKHRSS
jgi:hypothetical protein